MLLVWHAGLSERTILALEAPACHGCVSRLAAASGRSLDTRSGTRTPRTPVVATRIHNHGLNCFTLARAIIEDGFPPSPYHNYTLFIFNARCQALMKLVSEGVLEKVKHSFRLSQKCIAEKDKARAKEETQRRAAGAGTSGVRQQVRGEGGRGRWRCLALYACLAQGSQLCDVGARY